MIPESISSRLYAGEYPDFDDPLVRTTKADGRCIEFRGAHSDTGYASARINGRAENVHRLLYQILNGPLPKSTQLDHRCRNRGCVSVSHLEPVTQRTNLRRGDGVTGTNARKTHCIHGHEFTPDNTYLRRDTKYPSRQCRECTRIRAQRYHQERKAA